MTIALIHYPEGKPHKYFALQRFVLKVFGVSFDGYDNWAYRTYSTLWLITIFLSYTIVEFYEIYVYIDNMDTLLNNLSYLGTDVLGVLKIGILLYHSGEVKEMLDSLESGLFSPNIRRGGLVEEKIIKQCILISNRQTCLYYLTVVSVIGIGSVGTLINSLIRENDKELPFMTFSWFDASFSPNFEVVWFYQSYWRFTYAMMVSSSDCLIAGILSHLSAQYKVLQNAIRKLVENAYEEVFGNYHGNPEEIDTSKIPWEILHEHIKQIVDYHSAVIELAEKFEDLFSLMLLCIFLITLFILCFIMYHVSSLNLLTMRATQDFSYVAVVTLQVFLYCFWGNEVRLESERVADACWEADFVGTDVRFQKALSLIIMRSQKPIIITAGKFTDLSIQTYAWIIRASYSYYMVIGNHNQAKEITN